MAALSLPLTVRTESGTVDLVLRAAGPVPWSRARAPVAAAAGLPADTALYLDVGPVEDAWVVGSPPLVAGCALADRPADGLPDDPMVVVAVVAGPDAGRCVELSSSEITVGRNPHATLPLTDPQVSFDHAVLRPTSTGLQVLDAGSTNGVHVDGAPAHRPLPARTGSLIRLGGTLLRVQLTAQAPGPFRPRGRGHLVRDVAPPPPPPIALSLPVPPTRPSPRRHRSIPIASAVIGAALGTVLAMVFDSYLYLAFAALGPVMMLGSALSDRVAGRRSHRRALADYRAATRRYGASRATVLAADRRAAWSRWPDAATLLWRARAAAAQLWDRRPGEPGYLEVAVGSGARPTRASVATDGADGDGTVRPLVRDVPLTMTLSGPVCVAGDRARGLARWVLLQLVCSHSPRDLAITFVDPGEDLIACRYLPHVAGGIAVRTSPAAPRLPVVGDPAAAQATTGQSTDLLAVLDGPAAVDSGLGRSLTALARRDRGGGVVLTVSPSGKVSVEATDAAADGVVADERGRVIVMALVGSVSELPRGWAPADGAPADGTQAAAADDDPTCVDAAGPIHATAVAPGTLAQVCRHLAPLRDAPAGRTHVPAGPIPLADLLGTATADRLSRSWRRFDPADHASHPAAAPSASPCATIGLGGDGPMTIDLDRDGPHLLIAGTTGSGKSELLRSLIASLAYAAPPSAVTFLLVDYKGGAAFQAVGALPHVVGVLTDLDPALSGRALASLRAELRRRERVQAAAGPAPARLVIVIDEFATLATELPEFLAGLLDIAQRGRSLGLHLVLATQRPAGVVSPAMRANINTRICLRVTETTDSVDVIGTDAAARIPAHAAGRGWARTPRGLVAFQTALAGAAGTPELQVFRCADPRSAAVGAPAPAAGRPAPARLPARAQPRPTPPPARSRSTPSDEDTPLDRLIRAARHAARDHPTPPRPWLPPLPRRIDPAAVAADCWAVADLPDEQRQEPLRVPDAAIMVTGPTASGRTTALRRIASITAAAGHELLVVDAAGQLRDLAAWPQVSSYLDLADPLLVLRLLHRLIEPDAGTQRRRDLIIDHLDLVATALDRADFTTGASLLTEIGTRATAPVRLIASGPAAMAHQRIAAGFPCTVSLGSDDGGIPGRGRRNGTAIQIVDAPAAPTRETPGTAAPWPDPLIVRSLPTTVSRLALPAPRPEAVPVGVGGDDARAIPADLAGPGGAWVVSGPRGTGVTTALATLARGAADAAIPTVWTITADSRRRPPPRHDGVAVLDLSAGPEPLREFLAAHTGPLLLVVDQDGAGADHPAAPLLERYCRVCGQGQHLILGERADVLARAARGHLRTALSFARGILLQPDPATAALLSVTVPRRPGPRRPGRGWWTDGSATVPIQVARDDDP